MSNVKCQTLNVLGGVVVIPTVLMLGGLISVIALTGSLIIFLVNNGNYGLRLSDQAIAAAKTGVQDAFLKIIRDNTFVAGGGYNVGVGDAQVNVFVNNLASGSPDIIKKEIIAAGSAINRHRRQRAVVQIDKRYGQVQLLSVEEEAIP